MSAPGYDLTPRARELLVYLSERDACPSFDEMRNVLELKSKGSVYRLLEQLEQRGYIYRRPYRARSVQVLRPASKASAPPSYPEIYNPGPQDVVWLPLHGRID